jgi:L-arabinokinase
MRLIREHDGRDELLTPFEDYLERRGGGFFEPGRSITLGRAPARIDCMGGIADYSGSVVFEGPLREAAVVAFQPRDDSVLRALSVSPAEGEQPREAEFDLRSFRDGSGRTRDYAELCALFAHDGSKAWSANVLGAVAVLEREGVHRFERGGNFLLWRGLPLGAGVGSSAAMQVAAMFALTSGLDIKLPGLRLAALAQAVENKVVGAPCGIMDQMTSALGEAGMLLALRCQPCELLGQHELPEGVKAFGLNSRVHHSVAGAAYAAARVSAFMGLKVILAEKERRAQPITEADRYLCNIAPKDYVRQYRHLIPEHMKGADFLKAFGETTDTVTRVDARTVYRVRAGTDHPVFEDYRVRTFIECLERARAGDRTALVEAGGLMYASHWSYGWNCGLGCEETDLLVSLVRQRGPEQGLYGARVSGGGSGGTVAVLAEADAAGGADTVREIAAEYEARTGRRPDVFDGTSPGACAFGPRRYRLE